MCSLIIQRGGRGGGQGGGTDNGAGIGADGDDPSVQAARIPVLAGQNLPAVQNIKNGDEGNGLSENLKIYLANMMDAACDKFYNVHSY